jgi:hypothetical protein
MSDLHSAESRHERWRTFKRRFRVEVWFPLRRRWHSRHGIPASMLPILGKGQFVSVERHGAYLDLTDERTGDVIRLFPYQPNHGVEVEKWRDGRMLWRTHCDFTMFERMGFGERIA